MSADAHTSSGMRQRRGKTLILVIAASVAAVAQVLVAYARPGAWGRFADLHVYYGALSDLYRHGTLYDYAAANGDPFNYPPFAGLVFAPLLLFSEPASGLIWTALTLLTLAALAWIIAQRQPITRIALSRPARAAIVATALLISAPLSSNIRLGQISWFLVVLVCIDALGIVPARFRGVATGVAAAIKLTPLIFIPYYFFSGRRKEAALGAATFAACSALAWLVLPGDSLRFWLTTMLQTDRIGNLAMAGNQSIGGMLRRLGVLDGHFSVAQAALSAVVIALGLWRASQAARNGHEIVGLAIVGATAIAVSPVSWTHHQVWLLFAVVASFRRTWVTAPWRIGLFAMMVVSIGPLIAGFAPPLAVVTDNLRGLIAIAIAAALPFRELRARGRSEPTPTRSAWKVPWQKARATATRARSQNAQMFLLASVVLLTAFACSAEPDVVRPSGQSLVKVISSGKVASLAWQVEVVRVNGKLCTQAVVSKQIMGNDCDVALAADRPVNFVVEGNSAILFVHGVAAPSVTNLRSITTSNTKGSEISMATIDGVQDVRYFGYGIDPQTAVDLVALDQYGNVIYSGGDKIRSTRDDKA